MRTAHNRHSPTHLGVGIVAVGLNSRVRNHNRLQVETTITQINQGIAVGRQTRRGATLEIAA